MGEWIQIGYCKAERIGFGEFGQIYRVYRVEPEGVLLVSFKDYSLYIEKSVKILTANFIYHGCEEFLDIRRIFDVGTPEAKALSIIGIKPKRLDEVNPCEPVNNS